MKNILFISAILMITVSFKKEVQPSGDCGFEVSYAAAIRPIIESSSKSQEGAGSNRHDGWINDYDQIKSSIDPGAHPNRALVEMSTPQIPDATNWGIDSFMINGKDILQCWIDLGYPEN
jgi:hypothetical protein